MGRRNERAHADSTRGRSEKPKDFKPHKLNFGAMLCWMSEAKNIYKEGFTHYVEANYAKAVELYRRATQVDPKLAIAWNGLAMALDRMGDIEAAIEAGKVLVELEPNDPLSHTNLSRLYQRNGMIPEAEAEAALAMRLQMETNQQ